MGHACRAPLLVVTTQKDYAAIPRISVAIASTMALR
jgi:hypothetical protein